LKTKTKVLSFFYATQIILRKTKTTTKWRGHKPKLHQELQILKLGIPKIFYKIMNVMPTGKRG
jgi:hypothetical protein